MLFDEKQKSKIREDIKNNFLSNNLKEGVLKEALILMAFGAILISMPSFMSVFQADTVVSSGVSDTSTIGNSVNSLTEALRETTKVLSLFFSMIGFGAFLIGALKLKRAGDIEPTLSKKFEFKSKDLIYYISLSKEFKNEKINNFIISELKKMPESKRLLISKKIKEKDFVKNFKYFSLKLKSKEEQNLEKLIQDRKDINKKIKESEKVLGKRTNNISISND